MARFTVVEPPLPTPAPAPAAPSAPPSTPDDELGAVVRAILARHLHCAPDAVPADRRFTELGVDSLMAVEIVLELQERLAVHLYPTLLFELQTLGDLLRHLEAEAACRTVA